MSFSYQTSAFGGQGSIASAIAAVDGIYLGNRRFASSRPLEFSVIDNSEMLPTNACGLLGLSFLASIVNNDEVIEFNFQRQEMRIGPRYLNVPFLLQSYLLLSSLVQIYINKLLAGLLCCLHCPLFHFVEPQLFICQMVS